MKKEHLLQFLALLVGVALVVMAGCTPKALRLKDGAVSPLEPTKEPPECWKGRDPGQTGSNGEGAQDGIRTPLYQSPKELRSRRVAISFPQYPKEAVKVRKEDLVLAKISFFWDGRFKRLKFLRGDPVFYESITDAVESWRVRPLLVDGCPVETYTTYRFNFTIGNHRKSQKAVPGPQWGTDSMGVPNFTIEDTRGEIFRMADYIQTEDGGPTQPKKILMVFFSVFCEPCKQELPLIRQYYAVWKDEVQILLVSLDDASELAKLNELLPPASTPYPVVIDEDLSITRAYLGDSENWTVPSMLLIGKNGKPERLVIGSYQIETLLQVLR